MINKLIVFKAGQSFYSAREDRNGGVFEYNLIVQNIKKAFKNTGIEVVVCDNTFVEFNVCDEISSIVINGLATEDDFKFASLLKRHSKQMLFILTDANFVKQNMLLIELADIVLHQAPTGKDAAELIKGVKHSWDCIYSNVPELFYDETIPVSKYKSNTILFAGNIDGREDVLYQYIFNSHGDLLPEMVMFYKNNELGDFRVNYENYRRILSTFKYTFISGRTGGKLNGWVTPRFIEAINAGCIPFVEKDYDKGNHFGIPDMYRVESGREMLYKKEVCDLNIKDFKECIRNIKARKEAFGLQLIKLLCGGNEYDEEL